MRDHDDPTDLGFAFRARKSGEVEISRHGQPATILSGASARDFLARIDGLSAAERQQLMARLTGNYKRGNERQASRHPRNR